MARSIAEQEVQDKQSKKKDTSNSTEERSEELRQKGFVVLLSTQETAELLRLSRRTLEKWRIVGGGPRFLKLGRSVFYQLKDVQDWLAGRCRSNTSQDGGDR